VIDTTGAVYAAAGLAAFAAALLPRFLSRAPVSMPMVFVAAGVLAFTLVDDLPSPDPVAHGAVTLHLTEFCVIIALMGAGLAIDRPIGLHSWATTVAAARHHDAAVDPGLRAARLVAAGPRHRRRAAARRRPRADRPGAGR
jgi:hypothetical protein